MNFRVKCCIGLISVIFSNLIFIETSNAALYSFTSHTFTNCSATGVSGPTQVSCRSAYSTSWDENNSYFTVTSGIQYWTVPSTGLYQITAAGAVGGATPSATGGKGRVITTEISLTEGEVIKLLVGQVGGRIQFTTGYAGGGGGGSFVVRNSNGSALLIAGGGGGAGQGNGSNYNSIQNGVDASAYDVTSGGSGTGFVSSWSPAGAGGTNGGGGSTNAGGSSGGGFSGNGVKGNYGGDAGTSFSNGGTGSNNYIYSGTSTLSEAGGFGGGAGAGAHSSYEANGGGGGGYSGGGGGASRVGAGGGGGNYFTGTYISNSLNSGAGYVTITPVVPDTTPPTFTSSSSFSVAENIATSANAATIKVSESATVTISAGADAARFNVVTSDSVTVFIRFKVSPNFEAPSDVGANNVYELTLTATDAASNAGTQSITITVTDVLDTSAFNSFALAGSVTTATFRSAIQINASVTVASRITFRAGNIAIPGCKSILATGSGSTFTVSCNWKPSNRGGVTLSAASVPTNVTISGASAAPINVSVVNRSGPR